MSNLAFLGWANLVLMAIEYADFLALVFLV